MHGGYDFRGPVDFSGPVSMKKAVSLLGALLLGGSVEIAGQVTNALTPKTTKNIGTPETGVTAEEYGDGYLHTTKLTLAMTDAFTVADNAALACGAKLYTFPTGIIVVHAAALEVGVTLAEDTTQAAAELGLGTVVGSGANATLGAVGATCENILGPVTPSACDGTLSKIGKASGLYLADAANAVFLNLAATWADTAGTDLTGDAAGNIHLVWSFLGNPA
jgi:hypothetical protein